MRQWFNMLFGWRVLLPRWRWVASAACIVGPCSNHDTRSLSLSAQRFRMSRCWMPSSPIMAISFQRMKVRQWSHW
ncbi:hypothetical protein EDC04DRAFT_2717680 [Pisolithus marmoratus]|nr:hypothetical protein EDC04DRAFT_2717680 [Pisolithus marmoratus]